MKNTSSAKVAVMMSWLVTVNENGMSPIMLANKTNMNSVNTNGKNFIPSVPAELRTVLATNSYDISATDCSRPGTTARGAVAPISSAETAPTMMNMNSAELVKLMAWPPMLAIG